MPTLTPSAPAAISASAASEVAMFPPMSGRSGYSLRRYATMSMTIFECPCAVSTMMTSTPALTRAAALSLASWPTPIAAPTRRRPWQSFAAFGKAFAFSMSFIVMSPLSTLSLSTIGSFSTFEPMSMLFASSSVVPTGAVTRWSFVITLEIGWSRLVTKRRSRFVIMPTRRIPSSTTGTPEMW